VHAEQAYKVGNVQVAYLCTEIWTPSMMLALSVSDKLNSTLGSTQLALPKSPPVQAYDMHCRASLLEGCVTSLRISDAAGLS
jgi:hypothetical protein